MVIIGLALANPRGRHIVTTPIEHPSVLESCRYLERVFGFELTLIPVDERGLVDLADVAAALRPDTSLLSVGLANAEVGTVVNQVRWKEERSRTNSPSPHFPCFSAALSSRARPFLIRISPIRTISSPSRIKVLPAASGSAQKPARISGPKS